MSIRVSFIILAATMLIIGSGFSAPWENFDTMAASMKGGDPSTLTTSLDSRLNAGQNEFTKTVDAGLQATGAHNIAFSSRTTLTRTVDGHAYTTSSSLSEQLTFPKDSNVVLSQNQATDFTNLQNPQNKFSTSMWIDDPEFQKLFPSGSLDDIMKNFFSDVGGAPDLSMIKSLSNLEYLGNYKVSNSDSSNGVTRVWGNEQDTMINVKKLGALLS